MKRAVLLLLLLAAGTTLAGRAEAQQLGRLFFTPQERAALDAQRRARVPDKPAASAPSPVTRIDGRMQRKGQPATVWVNGEAVREGSESQTPGRRPNVGGTVNQGTGEVRDVIRGRIQVHRTPGSGAGQ